MSDPSGSVAPRRSRRGTVASTSTTRGDRQGVVTSPPPEFPIRLIALDIDGTLIGDDHEIGPRTVAAVRAAMDRDVAVSLITGRMVSSALRFARELGLTGPVVGYQGGLIRAMPDIDSRRLGKLLLHT